MHRPYNPLINLFLHYSVLFFWFNIFGFEGKSIIILSYFFLQFGILAGNGFRYSLFDIVGSACVIYSLMFDFNLGAFVVQAMWTIGSIPGLIFYIKDGNHSGDGLAKPKRKKMFASLRRNG